MRTIHISRYKPYEFIPLSQEAVLNSLSSHLAFSASHTPFQRHLTKLRTVGDGKSPVVIFGELELMLQTMV